MAATMADKRRFLAELASDDRPGGLSRRGWQVGIALAGAVLIVLLAIWLRGRWFAPRPVQEFRGLVDAQIAQLDRVARNELPLSEVSFAPIFERSRDLPPQYRDQLRGDFGRLFAARESAEVDSFFRMPAADRQAELDRRLKAEEQRRQQFAAAWANRPRPEGDRGTREGTRTGGGTGGAGGRPGSPGAGGAGGGGGPTSGRRTGTQEEWNQRSKAAIDRSTPEQRARRTEYRRLVQERREQLGMTSRR